MLPLVLGAQIESNGFGICLFAFLNFKQIAAAFDGGGHRFAAGCTIRASVEEAARLLVEEARKHLPKEQA